MTPVGGATNPHWVVNPIYPGDDLPPRGRSLFDFLTVEKRGGKVIQTVPFPFSALLQRVDAQMRVPPGEGKGGRANSLGRSLQRCRPRPISSPFLAW